VRFQITEKQLRTHMLKELRAIHYHSDRDIVGELLSNLENKLRDKERMILDKLVTRKKIGIGLGMGPGGGSYTYVPLDKITPNTEEEGKENMSKKVAAKKMGAKSKAAKPNHDAKVCEVALARLGC